MSEQVGWCVFQPKGKYETRPLMLPYTVHATEKLSIDRFISGWSELNSKEWEHYYQLGYRCKKVRIVEVEK
jgi:hypothetical protein